MKRVMVFGTFDILHPGHIYFLRQARKLGDFLIVVLAREGNVKKIKGHKPFHSEQDRKKLLESIKFVNKVVLGSKKISLQPILKYQPDVISLGYDQKVYTEGLKQKLARRGFKVRIVRMKPYKVKIYQSRKLFSRTPTKFSPS